MKLWRGAIKIAIDVIEAHLEIDGLVLRDNQGDFATDEQGRRGLSGGWDDGGSWAV